MTRTVKVDINLVVGRSALFLVLEVAGVSLLNADVSDSETGIRDSVFSDREPGFETGRCEVLSLLLGSPPCVVVPL